MQHDYAKRSVNEPYIYTDITFIRLQPQSSYLLRLKPAPGLTVLVCILSHPDDPLFE